MILRTYAYGYRTRERAEEVIIDELEFVRFAIQEAMNGNDGELMKALEVLELMREGSE